MKFLIIGLGSIGKRHIRNLIYLKVNKKDIWGFDPRSDRINECKKLGIENFINNFQDIKDKQFDGAFVCSPTSMHINQAIAIAQKNIRNIFIEKPLDKSLKNIRKLKLLKNKKKINILITYPFRFSKHVEKFKSLMEKKIVGKPIYFRGEFSEFLPDWHPYEKYNSFYMAEKKLGGGSILDQSHIIDIAHHLFGEFKSIISCFNSKISPLKVNADDVAEIIIKTKKNLIGSIHQDMFGRKHKKFMEVYCENGNITWDAYSTSVTVYFAKTKKTKVYNFKTDHNLMYLNQTKHIFEIIKKNKKPKITLEDGIHTLKTILTAEKKSTLNKLKKI